MKKELYKINQVGESAYVQTLKGENMTKSNLDSSITKAERLTDACRVLPSSAGIVTPG